MNIKLSSFLSYSVFVFKESFLPALNSQNKKVLKVAALAFVLLGVCYTASHYLYKKIKPLNDAKDLLNGKERNNIPLENKFNKDGLHAEKVDKKELQEKLLNGQNELRLANGNVLKGNFKDGKLEGRGTILYPNNDLDEGEFKEGELVRGKITYRDTGGRIEQGEFKGRKLNGEGKIFYSNKNEELGIFKDGKLNGIGKKIFSGGNFAEGEFNDGELEIGTMKYPDGSLAEGTFKKRELVTGKMLYSVGGAIVISGEWKNGKFNGWVKFISPKKTEFSFEVKDCVTVPVFTYTFINHRIREVRFDFINNKIITIMSNGEKIKEEFKINDHPKCWSDAEMNEFNQFLSELNDVMDPFSDYRHIYFEDEKIRNQFRNRLPQI